MILVTVGIAAACSDFDPEAGPGPAGWGMDGEERPGDSTRDVDVDIVCDSNRDCHPDELCVEGICQMARCDETFTSNPPVASGVRMFVDREVMLAGHSALVMAFGVDGEAIEHQSSWHTDGPVLDLAGGRFTDDAHMETTAVIYEGVQHVALAQTPDHVASLPYAPIAVAGGDVDGDGRDEVAIVGPGKLSLCDLVADQCHHGSVLGQVLDVAMGDVDGDGSAESLVLLEEGGQRQIQVWEHLELGSFELGMQAPVSDRVFRLDSGDFDGDDVAELVALADDDYFGLAAARLYLLQVAGARIEVAGDYELAVSAVDLAAGDVDVDARDELTILHDDNRVEVMRPSTKTLALISTGARELPFPAKAERIAMADHDGDSPRVELVDPTGELVAGPLAPLIAVHYPPYDGQRSIRVARVGVGDETSKSETFSDSVTLFAGASIGVKASLPGALGLGLQATVDTGLSRSQGAQTRHSISTRMRASPNVASHGHEVGVMLLASACYHVYRYEVVDPQGLLELEAEREPFVVVLPVGGTVTSWTSKRYNAMARALGLPEMDIPYQLGDPTSYPSAPMHPDGSPIRSEDMVFPRLPSLLVGDAADVGWTLKAGEDQANTEKTSRSWSVMGRMELGPWRFSGFGGQAAGTGYKIAVGEAARFSGSVPGIPDDPATPEDEYLENAFTFTPYVYREHYTDAVGEQAAYYVLSFAVGDGPGGD